jgi:hypothetical protein
MSDRGDPAKAASRIIRERAMAILRDTRSRIDPALLAAVKERLSPKAAVEPQAAKDEPALKQGLFKRDYKPVPPEAPVAPPMVDEADENGMVPVDKEKIAKIVLQYMKNREDQQKH